MEASLEEHDSFVDSVARSTDCDDMVRLNVCGTTMMAHRSTLRQVKDSVLASQFDDSKWTQDRFIHDQRGGLDAGGSGRVGARPRWRPGQCCR